MQGESEENKNKSEKVQLKLTRKKKAVQDKCKIYSKRKIPLRSTGKGNKSSIEEIKSYKENKRKEVKNSEKKKKDVKNSENKMKNTFSNDKILPNPIFIDRENLTNLIKTEESFKIQVFTFESIEIFESLLKLNKIQYIKGFTSTYTKSYSNSKSILLLIDDELHLDVSMNQRIILFSENRHFSFIPYKFKLSVEEKINFYNMIIKDEVQSNGDISNSDLNDTEDEENLEIKEKRSDSPRKSVKTSTGCLRKFNSPKKNLKSKYLNEKNNDILEIKNFIKSFYNLEDFDYNSILLNPKSTLTSLLLKRLNIYEHTASNLSYAQSVIAMSMISESKFLKIYNEAKSIDPRLDNRFMIKSELNSLINKMICSKSGNSYKLMISKKSVHNICKKIGFENVFQ